MGGAGGSGAPGGNGGLADGANGGEGGNGAAGLGGAIRNLSTGVLTFKPRLGTRKGSAKSKATNLVTNNQANAGPAGGGGTAGVPTAGAGGVANGFAGQNIFGNLGASGRVGNGIGGGLNLTQGGSVVTENTTITGNTASTAGIDVMEVG
jgi:hypothetical protein